MSWLAGAAIFLFSSRLIFFQDDNEQLGFFFKITLSLALSFHIPVVQILVAIFVVRTGVSGVPVGSATSFIQDAPLVGVAGSAPMVQIQCPVSCPPLPSSSYGSFSVQFRSFIVIILSSNICLVMDCKGKLGPLNPHLTRKHSCVNARGILPAV